MFETFVPYGRGAFCAILSSFPIAALLALIIGFPFPFAGYFRGVDAAAKSPVAVLIWGIFMGGFIVQGLLGCCAARMARRNSPADQKRLNRLTTVYALIAATPGPLLLSLLFRFVSW